MKKIAQHTIIYLVLAFLYMLNIFRSFLSISLSIHVLEYLFIFTFDDLAIM